MEIIRGSNISIEKGRLNYFRSLLLLGSIALPIWALYHDFTLLGFRFLFGLFSALLFAGSYRFEWVKLYLDRIIYALICISVITINKTLYTSNIEPVWAIYHITIFFGLSAVFKNIKWLLFFIIAYSIGTFYASTGAAHPIVDPYKFLFLYACSAIIMIIIAYSYSWTTHKIEKYAHNMAHNLRAPVARICGLMELNKIDKSNSSEYLKMLDKEVDDLNRITKNLQKNLD